ncbi:nitrilase-related carbon-nitrogen hydrolase [Deinococcus sp.]|uniref:nitrilase-related carbon-nitrogen hydrolase n=1 Tax=Deinococcus sp. TaxID=47478 RepID=UPI0025D4581F|nr:nitrilase-related carbon-nitrogen hydrolase [Deinococcus sp.]
MSDSASPASGVTSPIKVACCQVTLAVGDVAGNRARVKAAILNAAAAGAQVVVVPELANTGYMFADLAELQRHAEPLGGPTVREWTDLTSAHGLIIVGGLAEAGADGRVYNAAVMIDPSGLRASYRKAHLWDNENNNLFTPGTAAPPVVETALGRIGMMICYDLEFPEWVRTAALAGTDLLCAPVNWPLFPRPAGERPSEVVKVQAGASVNRMFIAVADRCGQERGQDWLGGSVIVDADGYPQTTLGLGREGMHVATLNLSDARNKHVSARNHVHTDRRTELYSTPEPD